MKPFGQHFLIDERVARCLINQIQDQRNEVIIEIGAGKGFITRHLLQNDFKVLAYEIDEKLATELKKNMNNNNLEIRIKDFLNVRLQELPSLSCCVGSIPYQISSLLIRKIIELSFQKVVLIVQKEFGDKITAPSCTRKYTFITVLSQSFYNIRKICSIGKNSFSPPPKVDSVMIVLQRKEQTPELEGYDLFLRKLFISPNKTVKSAMNLSGGIRPEVLVKRVRDLSVEEVIELYERFKG
ncbi:MAG: 16S rRNA (adenine(1518)-N(6)/adenine(1519)-N(6))-dimethyltransferase RsmA [Pseudothermotoga sp.]